MHRTFSRAAAVALSAALATAACAPRHAITTSSRPSAASPRPAAPRLVVALVVDQLPLWLLLERASQLPRTGGFARLLGEAEAAVELRFRHAHNATAPGHAALFTGASPHDSGVTSNGRLAAGGAFESSLNDPSARLLGPRPVEGAAAPSLVSLRVPTVADELRARYPSAFVAALSLKDRGALFGGGRAPTATLWFDAARDAFVSSSALVSEVPAWARPYCEPGAAASFRRAPWTPAEPSWLSARLGGASLQVDLGQGDFHGLGRFFPHDLASAARPAKAFVATPFSEAMLVALAHAAIDEAARAEGPRLLALSLSTHDYVAHVFGPDAPEAWDELFRLDAALAGLLDHLERAVGPDGYAVVLSADHGGPRTPEAMAARSCPDVPDRFERPCRPGTRFIDRELAAALDRGVDGVVGEGRWIEGVLEPFVLVSAEARARPELLERVLGAVVGLLRATPGIAFAEDVRRMPTRCPGYADESLAALACRSVAGTEGGDVYFAPAPGSFVDTGYVEGDGCNHGGPWLYDRAVPLVVRSRSGEKASGEPFSPARRVDDRAFAATVASLLGVEPPPAAKGGAVLAR
jgi:hypothetical protein